MSFDKWLRRWKKQVGAWIASNPQLPTESDGVPLGEPDGAHTPPFNNTPDASANSAPRGLLLDDFAGLKFRNSADCRAWKITAVVSDVGFRGGNITWSEGAGSRAGWNQKSSGGKTINGECILLIPSIGAAGMFDYARVGQREKILSNLKPSHEGPGFFAGWIPKKGERVGFCLATISRDRGAAKMQERSNVVWFEWPREGV